LRRYHGADWLDSTLYHFVINTGCISIDQAVTLVVRGHEVLAPHRADSDDDE
jgi:hypothetical protein